MRSTTVWLGCVVVLLLARSAHAELTIGICYGGSDSSECGVGDNEADVASYARKQCNFWGMKKDCREVVRCVDPGYFIFGKSDSNRARVFARCGVGRDSLKAAMDLVQSECPDCRLVSDWLGPLPPSGGGNGAGGAGQGGGESDQARFEREQRERERVEAERKQHEQQLQKEKEERDARLEREEQARHEAFEKEQRDRQNAERARQQKERDARAKNGAGGSGGGVLTAEQLAEQKRQQDIARGFQQLNEAQATNRDLGNSAGTAAGAVFAVQGGNAATASTTRALRATFAFGGRFLPVMSNTTGDTVVNESTQDTGGGLAIGGGIQYWPRYLREYGVGFNGDVGVAGMALPGGGGYALHAGIGAKGYYGNRARWTVIGELGFSGEKVGSSGQYIDAHVSGSGSYSVWRLGVGPSFCKTPSDVAGHCATAFYGELLLDFTSLSAGRFDSGNAKVFRLGATSDNIGFGNLGFELELGFSYPAPGETQFQLQPGDDRNGLYFTFSIRKNWTWHSGRAVSPVARVATSDAASAQPVLASATLPPPPAPIDATAGTAPATSAASSLPGGVEEVVFADTVVAVSSQFGDNEWSARQALGPPDVYPASGDHGKAWASQSTDGGDEFIELGFSQPRAIRSVIVYETFNPGAVTQIWLTLPGERRAYGTREGAPQGGARALSFEFACTKAPVSAVRVLVDSARVNGWNEIDSVAVVPCDL